MNIQIHNLSFNINKIEDNKIVFVKVIEKLSENNIIIDLNGEKIKARIEGDIPESFFAYVEKKVENGSLKVTLKVIESFKNIETTISGKSKLEIVKNFILSNSIPLIEDNINIVLEMLKKNVPLTLINFDIFKYSIRKYEKIPEFIIKLLTEGKKIDKDFIDIILNLKEIIKNENNITEIEKIINLINALSHYELNLSIKFEENKKILTRIETKENKKRYYFDFSSEKIKDFLVIIDISNSELDGKIYLEKEIISNFEKELKEGLKNFTEKLKKLYPKKNISLNFFEYKKNNIFENEISSENKNNKVSNLDIII